MRSLDLLGGIWKKGEIVEAMAKIDSSGRHNTTLREKDRSATTRHHRYGEEKSPREIVSEMLLQ